MSDNAPKMDNLASDPQLKRRLNLPLLVLYGLGVTIGAGIYVLIGLTAAKAGTFAPISFLIAAIVAALTAFSYTELSTRLPVSAGEAAYVREGFNSSRLSLLAGLLVISAGLISSATISIGACAYLVQFFPMSEPLLTALIIVFLGALAAWGVLESVTVAAIFTLLEIGGLVFVVIYAGVTYPDLLSNVNKLVPSMTVGDWTPIMSASLIAFFAFIGFEDLANMAEEVVNPKRNMPLAIMLTLFVATLVYLVVVSVVVLVVPLELLKETAAPLTLVFKDGNNTARNSLIAIAGIATLNGVLIQMIMASRVIYGLAKQGTLSKRLAKVHPVTRTPLLATVIVVVLILIFAFFLPINRLAELTSQVVLITFIFVNLSLIRMKLRKQDESADYYKVPLWVPISGALTSLILLIIGIV